MPMNICRSAVVADADEVAGLGEGLFVGFFMIVLLMVSMDCLPHLPPT